MYHFEYVTKSQAAPVKKELIAILNKVQNILRGHFTFQYFFIGSSSRNMITQDVQGNIGFDFDINLAINDSDNHYTPREIREMLKIAFDRVVRQYGYSPAEQSTRVLTIKFKDTAHSRIVHSCDIAIVCNYFDDDDYEHQEYIHFDKKSNRYIWEERSDGYYELSDKEDWIKENNLQTDLREWYLWKKNTNTDPNNRSRAIYANAVHEICQKYGYYD